MYLYFDELGILREVINDEYLRQGDSNSKTIYVYFADKNFISSSLTIERPDSSYTEEIFFEKAVNKEIPYDKNRDMKYFEDYKEYNFKVYELNSRSTQDPLVPKDITTNGLYLMTIKQYTDNNQIKAEGLVTFNVEKGVVKHETEITQSQYDYLMKLIARYIALNMVVDIEYSNYSMVVKYRDTTFKTFDFSQIKTNMDNIASLTQRVKANEDKLVLHDNELSKHNERLNKHDNDIVALNKRAEGIERVNQAQQGEIDNHSHLITLIQQDINTIKGRLDNLERNVGTNNDTLIQHNNRISAIENGKGQPNGYASLDGSGLVPASQLPSYIDDIINGRLVNKNDFVDTNGQHYNSTTPNIEHHIYLDLDTNRQYRWSGVEFVEVSKSLALGETSSTAYAGDKGAANRQALLTLQNLVNNIVSGTQKVGDSNKLGGIPSNDYALKTDLPAPYELPLASPNALGGITADYRNPNIDFVEIKVDPTTKRAYSSEGLSLAVSDMVTPNAPHLRTLKIIDKASGKEDAYTVPSYNSLTKATETELGGIYADPQQPTDTLPVRIGKDGKLYTTRGGYTLPIASSSQLGGVRAKAKTNEQTESVGVDELGNLYTTSYELPIATETILGGVKGPAKTPNETELVHVDTDGKMYVAKGGYELPTASSQVKGGIYADPKTQNDTTPIHIGDDGKLYAETGSYILPQATTLELGGVKAQKLDTTLMSHPVCIDESTGLLYYQTNADMTFSDTEYVGGTALKGIKIYNTLEKKFDFYNIVGGGSGGGSGPINIEAPAIYTLFQGDDNINIALTPDNKKIAFAFNREVFNTLLTTKDKGAVNGVASLGADGKVLTAQLPPALSIQSIQLKAPPTATNGTIDGLDLMILKENDLNYIVLNNEIYTLNDKTHTSDTLTYSHVGYENNSHWLKTISITVSTLSWVLEKTRVVAVKEQTKATLFWPLQTTNEFNAYITIAIPTTFTDKSLVTFENIIKAIPTDNEICASGSLTDIQGKSLGIMSVSKHKSGVVVDGANIFLDNGETRTIMFVNNTPAKIITQTF